MKPDSSNKEFLQDGLKAFVVPIDILEAEITPQEKLVYIVLRSFANPHNPQAFPSFKTIMRLSSFSRSAVIRALKGLEEKGYLIKETRFQYDQKNKTARQTSNLYHLNSPSVPQTPSVSQTPPQCLTDTPPVSHRHPPSVSQTPQELNHLTESFKKEEEEEEERLPFVESSFFEIASKNRIARALAEELDKAVRLEQIDYSEDDLHIAMKKLQNRIDMKLVTTPVQWFISTLKNINLVQK